MDMVAEQFDPDALDAAIWKNNPYYRRGCAVGSMIADLPEGEFRDRLIARLADDSFSHAALRNAIRQVIGVDLSQWVVGHHRRRMCRCPDAVRS